MGDAVIKGLNKQAASDIAILIKKIIGTGVVTKMSFSFSGVTVDKAVYAGIPPLLDAYLQVFDQEKPDLDAPRLKLGATKSFDKDTEAAFFPIPNMIVVRHPVPAKTVRFFGSLLHECTHAGFDLKNTQVTKVNNEAAAYLAETFFLFRVKAEANSTTDEVLIKDVVTNEFSGNDPIRVAAINAATLMFKAGKDNGFATAFDFDANAERKAKITALADAIKANATYQKNWANENKKADDFADWANPKTP